MRRKLRQLSSRLSIWFILKFLSVVVLKYVPVSSIFMQTSHLDYKHFLEPAVLSKEDSFSLALVNETVGAGVKTFLTS